jgi:hypothetical protein
LQAGPGILFAKSRAVPEHDNNPIESSPSLNGPNMALKVKCAHLFREGAHDHFIAEKWPIFAFSGAS